MDKNGTKIFVTDPSGTYVPYSAVAIGGNSDEVTEFLEKNYKNEISVDDAISLAISAINLKSDENGVEHIRMTKIKSDTKLFETVSHEEMLKHGKGVRSVHLFAGITDLHQATGRHVKIEYECESLPNPEAWLPTLN